MFATLPPGLERQQRPSLCLTIDSTALWRINGYMAIKSLLRQNNKNNANNYLHKVRWINETVCPSRPWNTRPLLYVYGPAIPKSKGTVLPVHANIKGAAALMPCAAILHRSRFAAALVIVAPLWFLSLGHATQHCWLFWASSKNSPRKGPVKVSSLAVCYPAMHTHTVDRSLCRSSPTDRPHETGEQLGHVHWRDAGSPDTCAQFSNVVVWDSALHQNRFLDGLGLE